MRRRRCSARGFTGIYEKEEDSVKTKRLEKEVEKLKESIISVAASSNEKRERQGTSNVAVFVAIDFVRHLATMAE